MKKAGWKWPSFAVSGIVAASFLLNFLKIGKEGFGDKYYAAAVKSMMTSWHNFFFASFDPGGFVTVDKPALGLWLQTLSASIFGFKGWALILPQALAGALAVGILYVLIKKAFGVAAGLYAALVLAVTPISVAASRTNQFESLVVLALLLAAWAAMIATERSSLKWLLVSMALIGLGFNIKMLAAFTVVPAFVFLYFLGSRLKFWKKVGHLAVATIILLAVSLSWALMIDLTPEDKRPYIGGSRTNSMIELAAGYNGINRLVPQWLRRGPRPRFMGVGVGPPGSGQTNIKPPANMTTPLTAQGSITPALKPGMMRSGGGPFGFEAGQAGVLRLFNRQMAGQISWLIVFGLIGTCVAVSRLKRSLFKDQRSQAVLLWLAWFFSLAAYFSMAGFFHRYYLALIAPAIAALCGISVSELRQSYLEKGLRKWVLPLAILATVAIQAAILIPYPAWGNWLAPLILVMSLISFFILVITRTSPSPKLLLQETALTLGLAGMLIIPTAWSLTPMAYGESAAMPFAGPDLSRSQVNNSRPNMMGPLRMGMNVELRTTKLVEYLKKNRKEEKFLLAVPNARQAWDIIIETGAPVMAMGGFMGADKILTVEKIERMVKNGDIRYFLVPKMPETPAGFRPLRPGGMLGMRGMFGGEGAQPEINHWIEDHGTPVPDEAWKEEADLNREKSIRMGPPRPNSPAPPRGRPMGNMLKLYDLGSESPNKH
jgi:4-amino-4-deoxy-L-arabinose transferase-like glycosyltransferase